jgi:ATP-dependent Zn protease
MFVGWERQFVRDLSCRAEELASCLSYEIDAVGRHRDRHRGGNDERDRPLNQYSKGRLRRANERVRGAATNRPDVLDRVLCGRGGCPADHPRQSDSKG